MLIGTFHHSTAKRYKLFTEATILKYNSSLRVIKAAYAFGVWILTHQMLDFYELRLPKNCLTFYSSVVVLDVIRNRHAVYIPYHNNKDDTDIILKAIADPNKMECRKRDVLAFCSTCTMQHDHLCYDLCVKMCICDECSAFVTSAILLLLL